jgi:hypothetical protein
MTVAMVMVVNGIFRVAIFAPRLGDRWAEILSAASGILLIQGIVGPYLVRARPDRARRHAIAGVWLVLTVAFELLFGRYVAGRSWSELAANYNLGAGRLWPVVLASMVLAPYLWSRISPGPNRRSRMAG